MLIVLTFVWIGQKWKKNKNMFIERYRQILLDLAVPPIFCKPDDVCELSKQNLCFCNYLVPQENKYIHE